MPNYNGVPHINTQGVSEKTEELGTFIYAALLPDPLCDVSGGHTEIVMKCLTLRMSTEAKQETWIPIPMWLAWCPAKTEGKSPTVDKLKIKNYKMSEETIYHKQEPERTTEGLAPQV